MLGRKLALGFLLGAPDAITHSRAVCHEGFKERDWGNPGEPPGVPHSPPASPVPALPAQTPWEQHEYMGGLQNSETSEPQPDFLRMSLIFFFFCLPQAAAPAAQLDVPSVHRAASARGPPPPNAAAANRGPLAAHLGVMHIWGDQRRITLLCMLVVFFFLYMCSDFFSVCHFDM